MLLLSTKIRLSLFTFYIIYLTIIPRARMGSESITHEAEGRMGYWLRGHEGERNNCLSKIQLVGQKHRDKTTLVSKTRFSRHCFELSTINMLYPMKKISHIITPLPLHNGQFLLSPRWPMWRGSTNFRLYLIYFSLVLSLGFPTIKLHSINFCGLHSGVIEFEQKFLFRPRQRSFFRFIG